MDISTMNKSTAWVVLKTLGNPHELAWIGTTLDQLVSEIDSLGRLKGGGGLHATDEDHELFESDSEHDAVWAAAAVRVAADQVGMDDIRDMTYLDILREAARDGGTIAQDLLNLPGGHVMFTVRLTNGRVVRLGRELTFIQIAQGIGALTDQLVQEAASEMYPDDVVEEVLSLDEVVREGIDLAEVKMTGCRHSVIWDQFRVDDMPLRDGSCVIDFIVQQLYRYGKSRRRLQYYLDDEKIRQEFTALGIFWESGVSVNDIDRWINHYNHPLGYYAIDPVDFKVFQKLNRAPADLHLTFVVAHGHCFPIEDPKFKQSITKTGKLNFDFQSLVGDTTNFKFFSEDESDALIEGVADSVAYTERPLELLHAQIIDFGVIPDHVSVRKGKMTAFVHPISLTLICNGKNWEMRKLTCHHLLETYECAEFEWRGQTMAKMARSLTSVTVGRVPQSSHVDIDYVDDFSPIPLVQSVADELGQAIDCDRCYTTALLTNAATFPVFTKFDNIEKFDGVVVEGGEYLVDHIKLRGALAGIELARQLLSFELVQFLLDGSFMSKKKILSQRVAKHQLVADTFKPLVEAAQKLDATVPGAGKLIVNLAIGCMNMRQSGKSVAYICSTFDEAATLVTKHRLHGDKIEWLDTLPGSNVYGFSARQFKRMKKDCSPVWTQVLSMASLLVFQKIIEVKTLYPSAKLLSIKTDSVGFSCDTYIEPGHGWKREAHTPPKSSWCPTRTMLKPLVKPKWKTVKELNIRTSCFVTGPAGAGKTYAVLKALKDSKKRKLCLAYTNKAVQNLRGRAGANAEYATISSVLWRKKRGNLGVYDLLVVDETSMIGTDQYLGLMSLDIPVVICLGDENQLPPVSSDYRYAVQESDVFICWLRRKLVLPYVAKYGRYDQATKEMLDEFLVTSRLPVSLRSHTIDFGLRDNIVYTNRMKDAVAARLRGFGRYKCGEKVIAKYNSVTDRRAKMYKNSGFFNGGSHVVSRVTTRGYYLYNIKCEILEVAVMSATACTVHYYQGSSCPRPFNIFETWRMSKELMYTALSRATKFKNIRLEFTDKEFLPEPNMVKVIELAPSMQYLWEIDGNLVLQKTNSYDIMKCKGEVVKLVCKTYSQSKDGCKKYLNIARGEETAYVRKVVHPQFTHAKFAVHVHGRYAHISLGGKQIMRNFTEKNKEDVVAKLQVLGLAEIHKRYGSIGDWSYIKDVNNKGGDSYKLMSRKRDKDGLPKEYVGRRKQIRRADRLVVKETIPEHFHAVGWYTKKDRAIVDATEKRGLVVKWGNFNFMGCTRMELVKMIAKSVGKDAELYEDLSRDVRLCADLDCNIDEAKVEPDYACTEVLKVAGQVARDRYGIELEPELWRVQSACTDRKVSFHIIYSGGQVFESLAHQKQFWVQVSEILPADLKWKKMVGRSNGKQAEVDRCLVDLCVYKSAQPLRCLYSCKRGKDNWLMPYRWDGGERLTAVEDASLRFIEENLATSDPVAEYSSLYTRPVPVDTGEDVVRQKVHRKAYLNRSLSSKPLSDLMRLQLADLVLPDGFVLANAKKLSDHQVRLNRSSPGLCPCCKRVHEHENAVISRGWRDDIWSFSCFGKPGERSQLSRQDTTKA